MTSGHPRSAGVGTLIDRYDAAWNAQNVDAIASMHDEAIVFHNHTAGERVAGAAAVRAHIAAIFARWPTLHFDRRSLRCGDDFTMICQPEIIVGTKVDHRARPTVVIDSCAHVGTGKQLWFIEFHRELGLSHPMRESGRRLEWITRLLCQEITQTQFCRVLTHRMVHCLSRAPVPTDGVSRQS